MEHKIETQHRTQQDNNMETQHRNNRLHNIEHNMKNKIDQVFSFLDFNVVHLYSICDSI